MIVYDVNKSYYGLCPLQAFRLSEAAIKALKLNEVRHTDCLLQENIRKAGLDLNSLFEEVPMKIHRSHLLQAFLFDHIQPLMPTFNTNLFRLTGTSSHMTQQLWSQSDQSQKVLEELTKMEADYKNTIKAAKKANKKLQSNIIANKDKTIKGSLASKADEEALLTANVEDS
jgi:CRISPR/Cas system CSM-associated protein Csm4 (group 5 of RAMP superfamily)